MIKIWTNAMKKFIYSSSCAVNNIILYIIINFVT